MFAKKQRYFIGPPDTDNDWSDCALICGVQYKKNKEYSGCYIGKLELSFFSNFGIFFLQENDENLEREQRIAGPKFDLLATATLRLEEAGEEVDIFLFV